MAIGFRRTVIALLFLSMTFVGCASQGKVNGGGTIIGNPKFPTAPAGPRQKTPDDEQEKHPEKVPSQQSDEEQPQPRTEVRMYLGGMLLSVVLKPSKWILIPSGLPPSERGLMRSPVKLYVVLEDSIFSSKTEE